MRIEKFQLRWVSDAYEVIFPLQTCLHVSTVSLLGPLHMMEFLVGGPYLADTGNYCRGQLPYRDYT